MNQRLSIAAAAAAAALCFAPGSAFAADTFVDPDTGSNTNNCTQATVGGPDEGPCATIASGVTKAAANGTVRIDRGDTYNETVFLTTGVSLLGQEVNASDTGPAIIDGGVGNGIQVSGGEAVGSIQGLTIRANATAISAGSGASVAAITQNTFDDPTAASNGIRLTGPTSTMVSGNTLSGDGSSNQAAISVGDGSSTITGNTIAGYWLGISAGGSSLTSVTSTPTISGNSITGTHQTGMQGGAGINTIQATNALIEGNSVSGAGAGTSFAIFVSGFTNPATTGVTLRRNRVTGHHTGMAIYDVGLPSSSTSDLVVNGTNAGLEVKDQGADDPAVGDLTVTNGTFWGSAIDVRTFTNTLTLDSSIVEDPIDDFTATCAISFSRGPTTSGSSCDTFQTSVNPGFVNAAGGDFHLQPGSPMINAGNPAPPPAGALDFDGQPRALAYSICGTPLQDRRDIGADETPPSIPNASCPPGPGVNPPATTSKKCKKGQKLKKGKCVKRKRKKRKKK